MGDRSVLQNRGDRWVEVGEAAEAFIEILNANGVDCIFVMPGTDTFPIQEAMAKYRALGKHTPRLVSALHESTAMSAAHGYYMVSGRPQVCLVHVDVGLQMIGGMLHNAQRGKAGIIVCSGKTPITSHGELRGGRDLEVHWIQDRQDQPSVVRDYVKWYYEVTRPENFNHVMQRAFQLASSEPAGPVYVSFLRELLMEDMGEVLVLPPERFGPATPGVPPPGPLQQIAQLIMKAERPVIVAGFTGRSPRGFHALSEFARATAVPVIARPNRAQCRSDHPMFLGFRAADHLRDADLVLLLDVDVPYIPAEGRPSETAMVVQVDIDPLKPEVPVWGFPVDLALHADTSATLPIVQQLIEETATETDKLRFAQRFQRVSARHSEWRASLERGLESRPGGPISVEYLSYCIGQVVDSDTIVVDDAVTSSRVAPLYIPIYGPGSYFKHAGSSMGWGSGAALGAKLAAPEKTVINLNSDGNFLACVPEAALWAAEANDAPFLTVIFNNMEYAAVKHNVLDAYPDGFAVRSNNFPGVHLPNLPDFEHIARSCRAHAERVTDPGRVLLALQTALDAVRRGQSAVVDVVVEGP